ncbi:MAG: hypothetical protein E4G98_04755, partial [Promethearchaeota archaeon]
INILQMANALSHQDHQKINTSSVQADIIYQISGFLPLSSLENIIQALKHRSIDDIITILQKNQGYSSRGLFRQIFTWITQQQFPYPVNEKLIEILGEYDYRLTLEADPDIQIHGFFAETLCILETVENYS